MGPVEIEPFSESRTYRVLCTLRRWADSSRVVALCRDDRAPGVVVGGVVLASIVSVFRADLGAGVQFLSFALLFVALAALIRRVAEPPAE